jgi:hypothetical protein
MVGMTATFCSRPFCEWIEIVVASVFQSNLFQNILMINTKSKLLQEE